LRLPALRLKKAFVSLPTKRKQRAEFDIAMKGSACKGNAMQVMQISVAKYPPSKIASSRFARGFI